MLKERKNKLLENIKLEKKYIYLYCLFNRKRI